MTPGFCDADDALRRELNTAIDAFRLAGDGRTVKQLLTVLLGPGHRERYKLELWPVHNRHGWEDRIIGLWKYRAVR